MRRVRRRRLRKLFRKTVHRMRRVNKRRGGIRL